MKTAALWGVGAFLVGFIALVASNTRYTVHARSGDYPFPLELRDHWTGKLYRADTYLVEKWRETN